MPGYPPPRDWSLGRGALLQLTVVCGDGMTATFECDDTEVGFEPIYTDPDDYPGDFVLRNPTRLLGYRINAVTRGGQLFMSNPRAQPPPSRSKENP